MCPCTTVSVYVMHTHDIAHAPLTTPVISDATGMDGLRVEGRTECELDVDQKVC